MNTMLLFHLGEKGFAIPLNMVERVFPMAEITDLPKAPPLVKGLINIYGEILPVFDVRKVFHLPEKEPELNHKLILISLPERKIVLWVDSVDSVSELSQEDIKLPGKDLPVLQYLEGVLRLPQGMILIPDIQKFLLEDEAKLKEILEQS